MYVRLFVCSFVCLFFRSSRKSEKSEMIIKKKKKRKIEKWRFGHEGVLKKISGWKLIRKYFFDRHQKTFLMYFFFETKHFQNIWKKLKSQKSQKFQKSENPIFFKNPKISEFSKIWKSQHFQKSEIFFFKNFKNMKFSKNIK